MRLIDADALKEYFKTIRKYHVGEYSEWYLADVLEQQPTVDAVPIIRCKDCKYAKKIYIKNLPWLKQWEYSCTYFNTHSVMRDGFCSNAERREE